MRTKYSTEEIDAIEIETKYFFSEDLMKSGLSKKVKQFKNNKQKGYTPKENAPKKDIYGIIFIAYGMNVYLNASNVSDDQIQNDEEYIEKVINMFQEEFNSAGCVDEYTQDQLLIFAALAKGKSRIRCGKTITDHSHSCFYIFENFIDGFKDRIKIIAEKESNVIEIEGIGFKYEHPQEKK